MIDRKSINYDYINNLYYKWLNERDVNKKIALEEEIRRIGPRDFLIYSYSSGVSSWPYDAFRNVFSLDDLFVTLAEMKRQGEDINGMTRNILFIESSEDIQSLNRLVKSNVLPEIQNFNFIFTGTNVLKYGDVKNIGKKLPISRVSGLTIEQLEELMKTGKDYKGIPITITIDNVGELPLDRLSKIEKYFDVGAVKIQAKEREGRTAQGETLPLTLRAYKDIRRNVDEIINNLYINENSDRFQQDFQLATQIISEISRRIEYDEVAERSSIDSMESRKASGMVGLLTGKAICKGYSEILRNVLSCVNIESTVIDGKTSQQRPHSWNQVKLGDKWFNVDLTIANRELREGKDTGDIFVSDQMFYGARKRTTFRNGNFESTVPIGGHSPEIIGSNYRKCEGFIPPYVTAKVLRDSRQYDETYRVEGKHPDYKGPVPYVGSKVERARSNKSDRRSNNRSGANKIPVDI